MASLLAYHFLEQVRSNLKQDCVEMLRISFSDVFQLALMYRRMKTDPNTYLGIRKCAER